MVQMEVHIAEYERDICYGLNMKCSPRSHVLHLGPQGVVLIWKNIELWGSNIE